MTLIDRIADEMQSDAEDRAKQSARLREIYARSNAAQKDQLDAAFICLCGWSLQSLLDGQLALLRS